MTHGGERRRAAAPPSPSQQTFLLLLLLLVLLVLAGQAGGQVDAGGPGGGGDGRRRLVHSLGDLGHGGEDPCRTEQELQVKIYGGGETEENLRWLNIDYCDDIDELRRNT